MNTTDATSTTSGGAATIAGGMAVKGSLFVGGTFSSSGAFSNSTGVSVTSLTDSSGLGSGSLYTLGGAAVSKSFYVGGATVLQSTLSVSGVTNFTSTAAAAVVISGGMTIAQGLTVTGASVASSTLSVSGITTLSNSTNSSGSTNGALIVTGGAGIGMNMFVGGNVSTAGNFTMTGTSPTATFTGTALFNLGTTDTTAVGNGQFVVTSGISIARTARFGGNVFVTGTQSVTGATTLTSVTASGVVSITNNTVASSTSTGALVVTGGLGLSGTLYSSGTLVLTNATNSTAAGNGAVALSGGLGVAQSVNIGSTLGVTGAATFAATVSAPALSMSGVLTNTNATVSTSSSTGSAIFSGGVGVAGALNVGGTLGITGASTLTGVTVSGVLTSTNSTDASSLTVASIVTPGGISIGSSLRVGTNGTFTGGLTVSGVFSLLNNTIATNTASGAAVISGGVGIGGAVFIGGTASVAGSATFSSTSTFTGVATFSNVTDGTSTTLGSIVTSGGIGVTKSVYVGQGLTVVGSSTVAGLTASAAVRITDATVSTSSTTGALVVTGGVGISGNTNCAGNITVTGTCAFGGTSAFTNVTDSNTSTSGAVVFSGGVGITRNLNVGGGFTVGAASTFTGAMSSTLGSFQLNSVLLLDTSGILNVRSATPTLRIAPTDAAKTAVVSNGIDIFTLGNIYTDANYESLQIVNSGLTGYSILSRAAGTGVVRRLVLQSGNNLNQVTLNTDGTVNLGSVTADTTATSNGAVTVSGGLGVQGSVSVGKSLRIFGATSGAVTFTAPATVTSYSLTLPSTVSPAANYALVSDTSGGLSWAQMTTTNPSFQSVAITNTTVSSGTNSGALTVAGGLGVAGAEYLGGNLNLTGGSGANMVISNVNGFASPTVSTRSAGTRFVIYPQVGASTTDYAIGVESTYAWYSTPSPTVGGHKWYSATRNTMMLDYAGNLSLYNGGGLTFTGGTSGTITLTPPATVTTYTLTLPTSLPSASNMALVSTTGGTLSWAQMITPNPTFQTVTISNATSNTGLGTGSLINSGGASIGAGLSLKGNLQLVAPTSGVITLITPDNNSSPSFTLPSSVATAPGQVLSSDTAGNLSWVSVQSTTAYTAQLANNVTTPTAIQGLSFTSMFKIDLYIYVTTSGGNYGTMATLRGFRSSQGWELYEEYAGDNLGFDFSINSAGQILYTSPNLTGWTGATLTWQGPQLYTSTSGSAPQTAVGVNNQTNPADVTSLIALPPSFNQYILVTVNNSTAAASTVSLYLVQGTQQPTGTWYTSSQIVSGPDPGIRFSIASTGQVQYTSPNTTGWLSTTFTFYGTTTALQYAASYVTMNVNGTTDATSPATGTLQVTGGAAINKAMFLGSTTYSGSNTTLNLMTSGSSYARFYGKGQTANYWLTGNEAGNADGSGAYVIYNSNGMGAYTTWGSTSWSFYSDARLKKDITDISDEIALEKVISLRPVNFKWKSDEDRSPCRMGLIAQEAREVIPEIVSERSDGYQGIAYGDLVPLLISSVKQLKRDNDELREMIEKLNATIGDRNNVNIFAK